MPQRGKAKFANNNKRARSEEVDDYVSDDGFVADGAKDIKARTKKARLKALGINDKEETQMWEVRSPDLIPRKMDVCRNLIF